MPETGKDPYQLLGVARTAAQDEIRSAYRALAKKLHPDLNPGNKAAEARFKEISEAYELIGTPENRTKYDRGETDAKEAAERYARQRQGPFYYQTQEDGEGSGGRYTYSFGQGVDEDIFESLFGGRRSTGFSGHRGQSRVRGEDQRFVMDVDLKEAVLGSEREIGLPGGKRLQVKIPAGVKDGMRLRFGGQGGAAHGGGEPGDAFVEIRVRPDERFRQEGTNLILELPISLSEAVLGGEVRAPTVEGEVSLKIPPHSNTDRRLRLGGKGLLDRATGKRGDQIVILKLMLPEKIDPELETFLRSWAKQNSYDPRRQGKSHSAA